MEVFSSGLACFVLADGQPKEAILYAVNFGRDTDCKAYTAGCFAGALRGIGAVPKEWVETVEKAVLTDPYTVSKRTMSAARGIFFVLSQASVMPFATRSARTWRFSVEPSFHLPAPMFPPAPLKWM